MKVSVIIAVVLSVLTSPGMASTEACFGLGSGGGEVCSAALSTIMAGGETFDGKVVSVGGFYVGGVYPMLFASREAYAMSDAANGVAVVASGDARAIAELKKLEHHHIYIRGRYVARPLDVVGRGGLRTGGAIVKIVSVDDAENMPWPERPAE